MRDGQCRQKKSAKRKREREKHMKRREESEESERKRQIVDMPVPKVVEEHVEIAFVSSRESVRWEHIFERGGASVSERYD